MNQLVISGSPRNASVSSHVGKWLEKEYQIRHIDLSDQRLPIFDGEEETIDRPEVKKYLKTIIEADALIIITPEYHGAMSGALKNALDYTSSDHFVDKPVLIISIAGGGKGGINALNNLRTVLRSLYAEVYSRQMVIDAPNLNQAETWAKLSDLVQMFSQKNKLEWIPREVMGL
ncbi:MULTISPECIES: NADPH-dependent FMN reductase [Bacillaceae]|uniref:NAD(P)H-dependent oxidoreductase n=1 Tax=Evansella alkalicola TaxID=745819 RepID=A0ABS6JW16_9BACI|nr:MULTISPECIES: NADPH-dependent FMN reductase [Bacillaceae]MBU9721437.1 NAD(P)H-dependent oxidoreductase [Bacillus alkalicola]